MRAYRSAIHRAAILLAIMSVSACTGDRFADLAWPGSAKDKERTHVVINMAGRWMLSSANRGQCGMNFTGGPKVTDGAIAPEGGCPGNFFTSRRWTLEEGNVIIRNHNGDELAKLAPVGSGRFFEGQATSGERIMLARQ